MAKRLILIAAGMLLAQPALATCYAVYSGERLVFRSMTSPVDLSRSLHETVPARFGRGATLMFFPSSEGCTAIDVTAPPSPLLTNEEGVRSTSPRGASRRDTPLDLGPFFNDRRSSG
jgi:hypothetical protein